MPLIYFSGPRKTLSKWRQNSNLSEWCEIRLFKKQTNVIICNSWVADLIPISKTKFDPFLQPKTVFFHFLSFMNKSNEGKTCFGMQHLPSMKYQNMRGNLKYKANRNLKNSKQILPVFSPSINSHLKYQTSQGISTCDISSPQVEIFTNM